MAHSNPEEVKARLLSILRELSTPEQKLLNAVLKIEKENLYLNLSPRNMSHVVDELVDAVRRTIA